MIWPSAVPSRAPSAGSTGRVIAGGIRRCLWGFRFAGKRARYIRFGVLSAACPRSGGAVRDHSKQSGKRWHVSDFRLEIDGLDCTNVRRIDSFAVRSAPTADDTGDHREPQKQPGVLDFPDLSITIARTSARSWLDWHDDFVVKGNNGQAREKSGSLVLLSRKKREVARVDLFNLGVYRVAPDRSGDVTARLYCERMEFRAEARPR